MRLQIVKQFKISCEFSAGSLIPLKRLSGVFYPAETISAGSLTPPKRSYSGVIHPAEIHMTLLKFKIVVLAHNFF
jgi:hypothetical protein